MLSVSELKALLRAEGIRLTKRLGQHHLVEARAIQRIVEQAAFSAEETVVEIGPGLGALTEAAAQRAGRVIAVEIDRRIASLLTGRMRPFPNVTVVCQDILEYPWEATPEVAVLGAIPYHITSLILVALCQRRALIRRAILVVQEEVAQRLLARPGSKLYGRLSVLGQFCWRVSSLLPVPRSAFFPRPEVDSRCLSLTRPVAPPVQVADERLFFQVVKAAFAQRRKTLQNCLAADPALGLSRARLEGVFRHLGLAPAIRGEALGLEEFAALSRALARANSLR